LLLLFTFLTTGTVSYVFLQTLKESLERRFSITGNIDLEDKNLVIATFIDPRFKDKFFPDKEKIKKLVIEELVANDMEDQGIEHKSEDVTQTKQKTSETQSLEEDIREDFWQCFNEIATQEDQGSSSDDMTSPDERKVYYQNAAILLLQMITSCFCLTCKSVYYKFQSRNH
jgi:hypothetical protein